MQEAESFKNKTIRKHKPSKAKHRLLAAEASQRQVLVNACHCRNETGDIHDIAKASIGVLLPCCYQPNIPILVLPIGDGGSGRGKDPVLLRLCHNPVV